MKIKEFIHSNVLLPRLKQHGGYDPSRLRTLFQYKPWYEAPERDLGQAGSRLIRLGAPGLQHLAGTGAGEVQE